MTIKGSRGSIDPLLVTKSHIVNEMNRKIGSYHHQKYLGFIDPLLVKDTHIAIEMYRRFGSNNHKRISSFHWPFNGYRLTEPLKRTVIITLGLLVSGTIQWS